MERIAQTFVNTCPDADFVGNYGSNWYGSTGSNPALAVEPWYNEIQRYNYNNPGYSGETGHFTQIVWADTSLLGCAYTTSCPNWRTQVVCLYSPPGNVIGAFAQNVL